MVEYQISLDQVFAALSDVTRRDILRRVIAVELTVGEIADTYDMSLAAISKHLKIMERAHVIQKRRQGKQQYVRAIPTTIETAEASSRDLSHVWNLILKNGAEHALIR